MIDRVKEIIAIKMPINFDLNKYLERRDKILNNKIQNTCLHMEIFVDKGEIYYKSFFESPVGTSRWRCNQCGVIVNNIDEEEQERVVKYYLNNPREYKKSKKKFFRLLRKKGIL